jgi:uncharacterized protein involved in outer membrane biogenesis
MALIVLLLVGTYLYTGSQGVRERLETILSQQLRVPVKVTALHYTPWSGLVAQGVAVKPPSGESATGASLDVPRISARVAWWPLWSHRLVVEQLAFIEPSLLWVQNAEGGWDLPVERRSKEAPALAEERIPQPQASPAPAPVPTPSASSAQPSAKPHRLSRLEFMIRWARIENATLRFVDREGENVAVLEGVNVDCPHGVRGDIEGLLSIRKATLRDGLTLEDLTTPFALKGGALTLSPLEVRLAGGTVKGRMTATSLKKFAPYTLDLMVDGVDLHMLQTQIRGDQPACKTTGTLHGSLDIYGYLGHKKSITGVGQIRLYNGRMAQIPLLQMIGKALGIEELSNLELQQAQLDLRAGEGKVNVDSLVLDSPNLSLTGTGTSNFNGKLNLDTRLAASSRVTRQLPQAVEANFQPVPGSDRKAISFHITGTVDRPQTDLMRVLVGQKIENELINVFRTLTGKPKKKSTVTPEASPDSQPLASPTP